MKSRLEQFLLAENLTQAQFADSIQVARAAVSHILAGRNNPGYDFIVNMMKAYPDLNVEWLLNGKGSMYKSEKHSPAPNSLFSPEIEAEPEQQPDSSTATTLSKTLTSIPASTDENSEETRQQSSCVSIPTGRTTVKIILFYSDNSYEEFSPAKQ